METPEKGLPEYDRVPLAGGAVLVARVVVVPPTVVVGLVDVDV